MNCHATSTAAGDESEINSIKKLFKEDLNLLKNISITANKS